jgi:hypothetical protein
VARGPLRLGVAQFFGGTTWDDQAKIYRPTPLATSGLAGVRPYWTRRFEDQDFLLALPDGASMGAVMCVHMPDQDEGRYAMGGVISGVKEDFNSFELWIFHYARESYQETAQAHLDDLLDAIKAKIRTDRTLGGICTQAGEGGSRMNTRTGLPATETADVVRQEAIFSFRADLYLSA